MSYLTRRKWSLVNAGLVVGLAGTIFVCATIGTESLDLGHALSSPSPENTDFVILTRIRLPRVLLAAVVGGALGITGAALQALLHNPLACPHILGVSGGAALCGIGALVFVGTVTTGLPGIFRVSLISLAAFAGAVGTTLLIYRMALTRGRLEPYALLLTGVVFNAFCGAVIMLLNSVVDFYQSHSILFWLMGSLAIQDYTTVGMVTLYVLLGVGWMLAQGRRFNLLSMGDEGASQLGVNVDVLRRGTFLTASFLVGAAVSVSGMIGFVGLIVPHLLRLLIGADHRLLLPASFLGGAIFLVWADTLARTVMSPTELPVGVVTAMCGGPFFLYLLRKTERRVFSA
ncbi:MAG: FecCD family ABC transporter permease [Candidatus Binatia bacterium]